jgi:hypothetical protein
VVERGKGCCCFLERMERVRAGRGEGCLRYPQFNTPAHAAPPGCIHLVVCCRVCLRETGERERKAYLLRA